MMDTASMQYNSEITNDKMIGSTILKEKASFRKNGRTPVFDYLVNEGCEHFFPYIDFIGLAKASDIVFLSSNRHFFYDAEELKDVSTVVNLKPLNHIKEIKNLLRSVFNLMPQKSGFIGCFVNNRKQSLFSEHSMNMQNDTYETSIESKIPIINKVYSLFDRRTDRYLSPRAVKVLLEESGLKVIDLTEINGLTYFYARKNQKSAE